MSLLHFHLQPDTTHNQPLIMSLPILLFLVNISTCAVSLLVLGYFQCLLFFYRDCCYTDKGMVKFIKPGFVMQACSFNTWEAETRGFSEYLHL